MSKAAEQLSIGRWVHCVLYGGKDGVIFEIKGKQSPETCGTVCNVVVTGGSAEFGIVWRNGTISRVPESLLRSSVQWKVLDEVATEETIDAMLVNADEYQKRVKREEAEAAVKKEELRAKYRSDNPHLTQLSKGDYNSSKVAAANMRIELKQAFPGVRFSVRMSARGGSEISVRWTDGPTNEQVRSTVGKYKYGSFNGMEDIYERDDSNVWVDVFGGVSYLSCSREYSDQAVAAAIDAVFEELKANYESVGISKPTVSDYRSGNLWNIIDPLRHHSGGESVQGDIGGWLAAKDLCVAGNNGQSVNDDVNADREEPNVVGDNYEVRNGTRTGYVEVKFNQKPETETRELLKQAKFRWSRTNGVWYGLKENLPANFQPQGV